MAVTQDPATLDVDVQPSAVEAANGNSRLNGPDIDLTAQRAFRGEPTEMEDERETAEFENYLLSVCSYELEHTTDDHDLEAVREAALEAYDGVPKDIKPGRSRFVSTDLADVVEWILPPIMKALAGSESCVSFDPVGEEDQEQAQQETDYCHHVLMKQNRGWTVIYSMVKDALLQKNGPAKVYWDESTHKKQDTFTSLTVPQLQQILNPTDGTEIRVLEQNRRVEKVPLDAMLAAATGVPLDTLAPMEVFDVSIEKVQVRGRCTVESMPPEELRISRDATGISLMNVRFVAHECRKTVSDLVQMGFPYELVVSIPDYDDISDSERQNRRFPAEHDDFVASNPESSTRAKRVYECYPLVDIDDDGVAERLKVYIAGNKAVSGTRAGGTTGYVFLGWERVDGVTMVAVTPIMKTHRFHGTSIFDRMIQIQEQKTDLWRQIHDNIAFQNNGRHAVVANQVNLNDLLVSRPGGIVRQKAPGMIEPLKTPPLGSEVFTVLEYLDKQRADRTGVSPESMFQGLNISTETAHGIERLMSAREELVGLIIRLMAETGLRDLYQLIRECLIKYEKKSRLVELRGKWVEMNPGEWSERYDTTVRVGTGPGDIAAKKQSLENLWIKQQELKEKESILVNERREYKILTELVTYSDLGNPDLYVVDPGSDEAEMARQKQKEDKQAAQQEQQVAMQAQQEQTQAMLGLQQSISEAQEETKRQKTMLDAQSKNLGRLADMEQALQELKKDYTEMELKYNRDVPGEGMEGGTGEG